MTRQELIQNIKTKRSFLCVGLDTDLKKGPAHLLNEEDPIFAFNKAIIDATAAYCVAYKPNLAFYEAFGKGGYVHCIRCTQSDFPCNSHLSGLYKCRGGSCKLWIQRNLDFDFCNHRAGAGGTGTPGEGSILIFRQTGVSAEWPCACGNQRCAVCRSIFIRTCLYKQ